MSDAPRAGSRSPVIRVFDCHLARPDTGGGYEFLLLRRASHKIYAGSWRMVGGKLTADSAGPGQGATFTLELPLELQTTS